MDSVEPTITEAVHWQPERSLPTRLQPDMQTAMLRGAACKCPSCGQTKLFDGYLTLTRTCTNCATELGEIRADDAPPYFTIFAVGHIVIPLMLAIDMHYDIPDWIQAAFWLPATLALTLALLRPIKGATVAVLWRLGMAKAGANV